MSESVSRFTNEELEEVINKAIDNRINEWMSGERNSEMELAESREKEKEEKEREKYHKKFRY